METREPLSLLAQALGMSWGGFALISQTLVIAAVLAFLLVVHRWHTSPVPRFLASWRSSAERLIAVGLPLAAGLFVAACGLYCYAWWPKPPAPRILEPDGALFCWLYCGVFLSWPWAALTVLNGLAMGAAGLMMGRHGTRRAGAWLAVVAGSVAFPVGLLALYAGRHVLGRPSADRILGKA